jgi:uroporphyrinogen-III synthase
MSDALDGLRVAVHETRELDLFVSMLERAGATALRCPLVSIHDLDDTAEVEAWIRRLAAGGMDDVVLYTGEGVKRLLGVAQRVGLEADYVDGLRRVRKIVRGPKPSRVLRTLGLGPDLAADEPTSAGLVTTLSALDLAGRRVGVQLYPHYPETVLDHLRAAGASVDPVLPYRYASDREDARVVDLLQAMAAGEVDVIALTSSAQVRRLQEVATRRGMADTILRAVARTLIAAVGPVTAEAAQRAGWQVAVVPETSFHLKPFIGAIAELVAERRGREGAGAAA